MRGVGCAARLQVGGQHGRLKVDDIVALIMNDRKKVERVRQLLVANEQINRARKAFDDESTL